MNPNPFQLNQTFDFYSGWLWNGRSTFSPGLGRAFATQHLFSNRKVGGTIGVADLE